MILFRSSWDGKTKCNRELIMKKIQSILAILLCAVMVLTAFAGCSITLGNGDIVILFTGDVANDAEGGVGYSSVAAYKRAVSATHDFVALIDCGNSLSGGSMDLVSKGEYAAKIMGEVRYDFYVLGKRDVSLGEAALSSCSEEMGAKLISANAFPEDDEELSVASFGTEVFAGTTVAFVGVTAPVEGEEFDVNGGKEMISDVQSAVDEAKKESDYVVLVSNLGTKDCEKLVAEISGICAVVDTGKKPVAEKHIKASDSSDVIYSSAGSRLQTIGQLTISAGGTITSTNVSYSEKSEDADLLIKSLSDEYSEKLNESIVNLGFSVPITNDAGIRVVENRETAIGDLVADAYAFAAGTDIALVCASEIENGLEGGDVTLEKILASVPNGGTVAVAEVSGQQLVDALEFAVRNTAGYYSQNGVPYGTFEGFLQVSGMTFTVNTYFSSTVSVDDDGVLSSIDGTRRVTNVRIKNESGLYEEVDLEKTYTVAGNIDLLSGKMHGNIAFNDSAVTDEEASTDYNALIDFLRSAKEEELSAYRTTAGRITIN